MQYKVMLTRNTTETFTTTIHALDQDQAIELATQQVLENDTFQPQFQEISGEASLIENLYTPISAIVQPQQSQQQYTPISAIR